MKKIRSKDKLPVDLRAFSGRSWSDLHDIWPADLRISSEAWKIISVMVPAAEATVMFAKTHIPALNNKSGTRTQQFGLREILWLAWIQRCEEARENVATDQFPMAKGFHQPLKVIYNRKSVLTKLGLVENFPNHSRNIRLYRVTNLGKLLLRHFTEQLEQAHYNLREWISWQPQVHRDKITKYLSTYCFDWEEIIDNKKAPE